MAEVGYLVGAGASAECVPVVNKMGDFLTDFSQKLNQILAQPRYIEPGELKADTRSIAKYLLTIMEKITRYSNSHSSIDTYAKKLFVSGRTEEYEQLKKDMALYFTLIQIVCPPDKRYDNFWASILNRKRPPDKVNIFSWNYDFQFEKSFMEFSSSRNLNEVWSTLNICSPGRQLSRGDENYFHFTKLNGSARFRNKEIGDGCYYCDFDGANARENIINLFNTYTSILSDKSKYFVNELKFAWEGYPRNHLLESIQPVLEKIEILVIIGYSFPFFNRKVDQQLFDEMTSLQKIIIQDMDPEGISERLIEFIGEEVKIELKRNVGQFVFPKQLEV